MQAAEPIGLEARLARAQRLDRRPDALQPRQRALPGLGDAHRIGRHERQPRAARERLAHAHPGVDAKRLGGLRDLADEQLAARLRRKRRRLAQQPHAAPGSYCELEALEEDTDDRHTNTCSQNGAFRVKAD